MKNENAFTGSARVPRANAPSGAKAGSRSARICTRDACAPGNRVFLLVSLTLFIALVPSTARADLSAKQVRTLITKVAGMSLPSASVRTQKPVMLSATMAQAVADIDLVFRVTQSATGVWQLTEVRAGQDQWEDLGLIARAARAEIPRVDCDPLESRTGPAEGSLTVKRARCLVAALFDITVPSDHVRIKSVSGLALPLASESTAVVVAVVRLKFGFLKDRNGWHVNAITHGDNEWSGIETIEAAVSAVKSARAQDEMKTIAMALDKFRRDRGTFVVSDKHPALIDHLSPHYLPRVIRLDPWHNSYEYIGERDRFTLRSAGPDRKLNTPDDVVLSVP
jgi:Type II secretion system (T2SS), protein G